MNKPVNKPLHKDPSFWIVAIVIGVAVNAVQINYGWPWFTKRLAQMKTAPRTLPNQPRTSSRDEPNLDMRKKTYSWQVPQFKSEVLEGTPPQVVLIPTEYERPSGGWGSRRSDRAIGIRMAAEFVVQSAYNWPSRSRIVLNDPLPSGEFDFFAKQPSGGALEALQAEIGKQWGLIAEREMRKTNVLAMRLDHRDAPGLKPGGSLVGQGAPNAFRMQNVPVSYIASYLENWSQLPVIDETGLTGNFDILVPSAAMNNIRGSFDQLDKVRALLREQLGLDLIQTNATVEMLVVKKAK